MAQADFGKEPQSLTSLVDYQNGSVGGTALRAVREQVETAREILGK